MRGVYPISVVAMFFFAACISGNESAVDNVGNELEQTQLEVQKATEELAQSVNDPINEERAVQLAARHLALKQVRWGKPVAVEEDAESFYVTYQTPQQELRIIGARMLVVDKDSKVVTAQKKTLIF